MRLSHSTVTGFIGMLLEGDVGRERSLLPSMTELILVDTVVDKCWAHLAALWTLGTWTLRLDYGLVD